MGEGFQQIILVKSEADAGLKQINVIDETFRVDFHLISLFSSLILQSVENRVGKWPSRTVFNW